MSTPTASQTPRTSADATRAVLLVVVIGALLAGGVSVLLGGTPGGRAASPTLAAEQAASPAAKAIAAAAPGTCLTWTRADAADITRTACANPHLFEVAADIDLGTYPGEQLGPDAAFPGTVRLAALRTELCTPAVARYLDRAFDPYGRYTVGLINPGEAGWAAGERTLRCGLQNVGRSGTPFPVTGTVAASDQSDVTAVGTCLGIDSTQPTDPVPCSRPHASETVAVVDLGTKFPTTFPSTADQDAYLDATCATASDTVIGAADGAKSKGLTVFWDDLQLASWSAGSRRVNCYVGQQLTGGGFAPVTGASRGEVTIGTAAAPPATTRAPAPAPAPTTGPPTGTPQDGG